MPLPHIPVVVGLLFGVVQGPAWVSQGWPPPGVIGGAAAPLDPRWSLPYLYIGGEGGCFWFLGCPFVGCPSTIFQGPCHPLMVGCPTFLGHLFLEFLDGRVQPVHEVPNGLVV